MNPIVSVFALGMDSHCAVEIVVIQVTEALHHAGE